MKLIIEIDDEMVCNDIKYKGLEAESATDEVIINALYNGIPYEDRPQGEWKKIGEEYYNWSNHVVIKCPHCGYVKDVPDLEMAPHFCENCGADMKGGKE